MPQYNHNLSLTFFDVLMSSVQDPEEFLRNVKGSWYLMESEGLSCQDGLNEPPSWIRVEGKDIIKPTETMFEQEFQ